jgi:Flp pilus assembly protein TadB
MTLGIGAPVASTVEDATSLSMSVVAIIIPVLVIFFLVGVAVLFGWLLRRRGRTRRERQARRQV